MCVRHAAKAPAQPFLPSGPRDETGEDSRAPNERRYRDIRHWCAREVAEILEGVVLQIACTLNRPLERVMVSLWIMPGTFLHAGYTHLDIVLYHRLSRFLIQFDAAA